MIQNRAHVRFPRWLLAFGRAVCSRTLLAAILLLVAALDPGSPWIAMTVANEAGSCCPGKGAACCRRMHRDGPSWQDRSCCGTNGLRACGTFSANALWVPPSGVSSALLPSENMAASAAPVSETRLNRFSLRQRPPPSLLS